MDEVLWNQRKQSAADWFRTLRGDLCARLESLEPNGAVFERKTWTRGDGSEDLGGGEMSMLHGAAFEKAGVHISTVYGEFSEEFRKQVAGAQDDPRFWAGGISVIIHPTNPNAPTAHMNTRMVVTTKGWFGGGGDLTPMLDAARRQDHEDTVEFHGAFKRSATSMMRLTIRDSKKNAIITSFCRTAMKRAAQAAFFSTISTAVIGMQISPSRKM